MCFCISHPACKSHLFCAALCYLWPVCLYPIFSRYLMNGTIFGKTLLTIKCVFWFSLQLLSETLLVLRRIQGDIIINVLRRHVKYPLFLSYLNETWIFSIDFWKIIKFNENPCSGSRVVPYGRTDMTSQYWLSALLRTRLKSTLSKREEEEQVGEDKGRQRLTYLPRIYQAHDICNSRSDCKC